MVRLVAGGSIRALLPDIHLESKARCAMAPEIGDDLAFLKRELAGQKTRIEELERSAYMRRSLRDKLHPTLWTFRQYPARPLTVPASYQQSLPADPPRFAIVTPTLNGAQFLVGTIESVLNQGYPNLAYLVQDGGSNDGTEAILKRHGSKLMWRREADRGQADALNRGFQTASGEIMAYLNADDLLLPGTLAFVADVFARNPDVDVVYGNRITIDEDGKEIGRIVLPPHDHKTIRWVDYIPQETMFWRARVWESVGPFDITFSYAMDWDFILRAHAAGFKFLRAPRFLGCFRIHPEQKTTAMIDVGAKEQEKLRRIHLGTVPDGRAIGRNIASYLRKQVLFQRLYKLGVLRI
jgi:glycosyltransferase involved in cell wall biosynthesis